MSAFVINPYSFVSEDADAKAYLDAVEAADTQALEAAVRKAVDDFVKGCKADGIWTAIKASCILAGARTLAGALTPLVGSAPTNVGGNFVSGDYNRETGLVGDGTTKYLDSNRNNDADPQNSKHIAVFATTFHTRNVTRAVIGTNSGVGDSHLLTLQSPDRVFFRINYNVSATVLLSSAAPVGFWGSSRSSSAGYTGRFDGSSNVYSDTSTTPRSASISVFNRGTGTNRSNARLAFYSIGESIDLDLLDARVSTLITDIDAAI